MTNEPTDPMHDLAQLLDTLVTQVRGRIAMGMAARVAAVTLVAAGAHAVWGGSFSLSGIVLLAALPVAVFCVGWTSALGAAGVGSPGMAASEARRRLAQALDHVLAAEDRLPSALDPAIAAREDAGARVIAEDAGALAARLPAAAAELAPVPWRSLRLVPLGALVLAIGLWTAPEPRVPTDDTDPARGDVLTAEVTKDLAATLDEARIKDLPEQTDNDPLAKLAKQVTEADVAPSEALAAAAEAMEAMERERAQVDKDGAQLEALAKAMMQFEEMKSLARELLDHRLADAGKRLRDMRDEIEAERKNLLASKEQISEEEMKRRLEDLSERERRLDELEKAMRDYGERLERMNRRMDAAKRMADKVRYAQRTERKRYRDWLDEPNEGDAGGRQGPRTLGGNRDGAGLGGDDWGRGTASHQGPPNRTSVSKVVERVAAEEGEGGVTRFFVSTDDDQSKSRLDYGKFVGELQRKALDTIYQEEIPLTFRRYVSTYFDHVKPPAEADEDR